MGDYGFFKAFEQMKQDVADIKAAVAAMSTSAAEIEALKQRIADLIDAADIAQAAKDALQLEIDNAFLKSESVEGEISAAATPTV